MLKKLVLLGLGLFCAFTTVAADGIFPEGSFSTSTSSDGDSISQWSSVIEVSGGLGWADAGQNQYLYPITLPSYQYYTANSSNSTMGSAEVLFALQSVVHPQLIGQLGLGGGWMSDADVSGYATVNGNPNAFSYSYKVNHARIHFKGKLIGHTVKPVQPYLSASLGVAFNDAHEYQTVTINPLIAPPYQYVAHVAVAFPYSFGAGLQTSLSNHWQVGVGYQFSDLGKSYLKPDQSVTNSSGLRLTHFYTNEVLFSLAYTYS